MRIYADRFYVLTSVPGISGFQRWNEREYRLVTGLKARNARGTTRDDIFQAYAPDKGTRFALEDGHIQGHQPIVEFPEACAWLTANPFQAARILPSINGKVAGTDQGEGKS